MRAENPGEARLGRKAVFSPEIESQLKEYVLTLAKLFYGLTPKELRRLAFKYAEEHKIKHGFPSNKQAAGKDWLYGFLRRNPEIKLMQPEGTSINRIASFNSESTKKFFANLKVLMDRYHFPPQKIFNMDETGVTVVQKKYNHSSHISLEAYRLCRSKFTHLVSLPPHTSDHLQPLDLTFFGPLKNQLYREYDLQLTNTAHEKILEYELAELLNKAFLKVATMEKAISGFRTAGIYPLNPDRFTEDDFAAANQMRPLKVAPGLASQSAPSTPDLDRPSTPDILPTTSRESPVNQSEAGLSMPDVFTSSTLCNSFFSFAPIPKKKLNPKATKRKCRDKQSSEILTSTPMKEQLEIADERRKISAAKKVNTAKRNVMLLDNKKGSSMKQNKSGKRKSSYQKQVANLT
nr:unnamed protein product [Callosobruchus chinensis]